MTEQLRAPASSVELAGGDGRLPVGAEAESCRVGDCRLPCRHPSYVVLFLDRVSRPSFSSIASVTNCMSTISCVTQCSLRRR